MASNNINIRRDVKDPYYRYKMPRLLGKIEGKGNGIKTVLPNIVDVARALSRPPDYPTKYFGIELGAQVKVEEKNEKYIVNGAHDVAKLQDLLDGFIDRFVLCASCKSPETDLVIHAKDQSIIRQCMACGQRTDVDLRHRLATYIVKNPPPKTKKGGQHASAAPGQDDGADGDHGSGGEVDLLARDASKLDIAGGATNGRNIDDDGDDDDEGWDVELDMSAEAIAARQKALSGGFVLGGADNDDDDENNSGGDDPYDQLGDFIKDNRDAPDSKIYAKATELHLAKKHRALIVVILCLFENSTTVAKDIAKHDKLLLSFGNSDKHQRAVIGGFERLIEARQDSLLPKTPAIFKALFDEEIVEEEAFLEWAKKPSKKYVDKDVAKLIHKAAQPFVQWLAEAEEESDSDEE
ncbi:eukaryotic translation initiation factor 5 [Coemansia thaxteri]|uniref:Eukaryotic translation initiation factor 5 n=1 Tax=Coemansia thaxteri TaxID=2663907 RepID=A0A9W8BF97_9FUNG|nr:eukaryotic translation initiation factor 5 [Coemansia thaxteri]KAJ2009020.1 eukaryotic translation initiation factor 5 [Coemansia thaxteri]KAJ2473670.1 eukaryotic translation initiation factor 5 [Coemansia sp. RSA 2322]KAJ2478025.1 eukaryotic translation initiation factor 5 [Coemansia sp. RSA 2320]